MDNVIFPNRLFIILLASSFSILNSFEIFSINLLLVINIFIPVIYFQKHISIIY